MSEKEKTHPTAATVERAAEKAACDGAAISTVYFNGSTRPRQAGCVSDILPVGAANAISARTLAAVLGLKDVRSVSRLVELERRSGVPICASVGTPGGYFLPSSPCELERYLKSLNRRICEIRMTHDAINESLRRLSGQEIMMGWSDG